jgi:hypothetical protein
MRHLARNTCPYSSAALKRTEVALDIKGGMRTEELKLRVQRADYVVDPAAVAEAMLRHAVSHRRWWNPSAGCSMPREHRTAPGAPATTSPTQVNAAADAASARASASKQTQSS